MFSGGMAKCSVVLPLFKQALFILWTKIPQFIGNKFQNSKYNSTLKAGKNKQQLQILHKTTPFQEADSFYKLSGK